MATRTEAAKNRLRHERTGQFVSQRTNGHGKKSPSVRTPIGVSSDLTRILRPQAAFRWLLPPVAAITPQYLEMVLRGALAGNHVQQWELFDLMFDTWPALGQCLQELTYGVLTKKIVYEPYHEEDEKPTAQAVERCSVVSTALRDMNPEADRDENALRGTIADLVDSWVRGISVLEIIWEVKERQKHIVVDSDSGQLSEFSGPICSPKSTFWVHPVAYGFSQDGIMGLRSVSPYQPSGYASHTIGAKPVQQPFPSSYLQATPQPAALQTFPEYKFLIGIHKAKSGTALAGPMLRPLCWWWLAANFASDWLLNLAQLFGLPFRYATYDPNAPEDTIGNVFNMLQNMGTAGWAAFPVGTTLEFKETGGGRQAEYSPQGTLLDRADRYARELILGQTMTGNTMHSGKGGQAFGEVEKDVKAERIEAAGHYACDIINKQLIPAILKLNYDDADEAPTVRLLEENEGDYQDAQRDQILKSIGLPMGIDFMRKKYGIPEPAEDEEILVEPTPPSGGNGFGNFDQSQPQNLCPSSENDTAQTLPANSIEPAQSKAGRSWEYEIMRSGGDAMKSASGAYAPGHEFYGNQFVTHSSHQAISEFTSSNAKDHQLHGVYFSKPNSTKWGDRRFIHKVDISSAKLASPDHAKEVYLDEMGKGAGYGKRASDRLSREGYHGADLGQHEVVLWDTSKAKIISVHDQLNPRFPSITRSAEDERRTLQNAGIQT